MRHSRHSALLLTLAAGAGLLGCGGDDPAPPAVTPSAKGGSAGAAGVAGGGGKAGSSGGSGKAGAAGAAAAAGSSGAGAAAGAGPGGSAGAAGASGVAGAAGLAGASGAAGLAGAGGFAAGAAGQGGGGQGGASGAGAAGAAGGGGTATGGGAGAGGSGGAGGASAEGALCTNDLPCPGGFLCAVGRCVPAEGACAADADCGGDTYCCAAGCTVASPRCVPYGKGPRPTTSNTCNQASPAVGYEPVVQCSWIAPEPGDPRPDHKQMLSTIVAGPLPIRAGTSLVAVASNCLETVGDPRNPGDDPGCFGLLRIFSGSDCKLVTLIDDPSARIAPTTTPAIGDIDGDGVPEIVAVLLGGGLVAYRWNPGISEFTKLWTADVTSTKNTPRIDGPTLHDLDHNGVSEVLLGFDVYDGETGERLNPGQSNPGVIPPVVVNLPDLLPKPPESPPVSHAYLFLGGVFRWDIPSKAWTLAFPGDAGAVANVAAIDFGTPGAGPQPPFDFTKLDGIPEVLSITGTGTRITTLAGAQVYTNAVGSRAAVLAGNFDGDGGPEFALPDTGGGSFVLGDPGCAADPSGCLNATLRWNRSVNDDGFDTPSAAFDFNGDGRPEIVHADQCFVRIHDGITGEPVFSAPRQSCTFGDYPTVVDVDGDNSGELVVGSNGLCSPACPGTDPADPGLRCVENDDCRSGKCDAGYCRCTNDGVCGEERRCATPGVTIPGVGSTCRATHAQTLPTTGFRIYRDKLDRWAQPRPIWNQHAFSGTNIDDSGAVPKMAATNVSSIRLTTGATGPLPAADATLRFATTLPCRFAKGQLILEGEVCNRGAKPIPAGLGATAYLGDPALGQKMCVATTATVIEPGACAPVSCQQSGQTVGVITWRANDSFTKSAAVVECNIGNNKDTLSVPAGGCPAAAQ